LDANKALEVILNALLGGGGVVAFMTALRAYRSHKRGVPGDEAEAVQAHAQAAADSSPDWAGLNTYWKAEIINKAREVERVRKEVEAERQRARQRQRRNEQYIDALEAHIWQHLPPPPRK
jgi:hypothetical protein